MTVKIDIHAVLKQAIKDLPADASPADVASYIDAECQKQAAIEGAAAKEEKAAEKEVDAALEDAPKDVLPIDDKGADKPGDPLPKDEPPPAMSQVAPAAVVAAPSGTEGANGPGADLDAGAADAGLAQLEALLAEKGSSLPALLDALKSGALDGVLAGGGMQSDAGGMNVNEGQMEGTQPLSALKTEVARLSADVARLSTDLAAKDTVIATLSARAAGAEKVAEKTEAEKKAEAEAAAEKTKQERRTALSATIADHIRCARLIPAQGRSVEQTIETWTELGMSQSPEKFDLYLSTALGPGVPTEAITTQAALSAASPGKDSRAGSDADEETPEFKAAFKSYRAQFGEEDARKHALASVKRARNGAASTPTTKITGTA